jgi:acyl-CoA synthetase (AMP-forming)/AMP-acid ligase II
MGERLVALVVPEDGDLDADELTAYCRERIAGYKRPKEWLFTDALPRTVFGKVDKRSIRSNHPNSASAGA